MLSGGAISISTPSRVTGNVGRTVTPSTVADSGMSIR